MSSEHDNPDFIDFGDFALVGPGVPGSTLASSSQAHQITQVTGTKKRGRSEASQPQESTGSCKKPKTSQIKIDGAAIDVRTMLEPYHSQFPDEVFEILSRRSEEFYKHSGSFARYQRPSLKSLEDVLPLFATVIRDLQQEPSSLYKEESHLELGLVPKQVCSRLQARLVELQKAHNESTAYSVGVLQRMQVECENRMAGVVEDNQASARERQDTALQAIAEDLHKIANNIASHR